jgi:hypothetical protein
MQLMVMGDKWELYIPSKLAHGKRGLPPKISGYSDLVFTIEMIEIQDKKVIALKCNPKTLEDCDKKMKTYIDKAKMKFGKDGDELEVAAAMKLPEYSNEEIADLSLHRFIQRALPGKFLKGLRVHITRDVPPLPLPPDCSK